MFRRAPTKLLMVATLTLALTDWFETSVTAEMPAPEPMVEPPEPQDFPASANLARSYTEPTEFGDCTVHVEDRDGRYVIVAMNKGDDWGHVRLNVEVWEQTGEMYARMVPPAEKVAQQVVALDVAPHGQVVRVLSLLGIDPPPATTQASGNRAGPQLAFGSRQFRLVDFGSTQAARTVSAFQMTRADAPTVEAIVFAD